MGITPPALARRDEELLQESSQSALAFKELVQRYSGRLYGFVRRAYFFSHEDAEDVVQEAFLKAYRYQNAFDPTLSFSTWMYQITRNTAIDALRKRKRLPETHSIQDEDHPIDLPGPDEFRAHVSRERFQELLACIQALPLAYREPMMLKYLEERSYEEMIDILKKPKGTIASLLNRGKVLLKQQAGERGLEFYEL